MLYGITGKPPSQPALEDETIPEENHKREDHSFLEPASAIGV